MMRTCCPAACALGATCVCPTHVQVVPAVVGAYRCNGTVDWLLDEHPYYPPTVNDHGAASFARGVAGKILGIENVSGCTWL